MLARAAAPLGLTASAAGAAAGASAVAAVAVEVVTGAGGWATGVVAASGWPVAGVEEAGWRHGAGLRGVRQALEGKPDARQHRGRHDDADDGAGELPRRTDGNVGLQLRRIRWRIQRSLRGVGREQFPGWRVDQFRVAPQVAAHIDGCTEHRELAGLERFYHARLKVQFRGGLQR